MVTNEISDGRGKREIARFFHIDESGHRAPPNRILVSPYEAR